jgi:hypothetical protein
MLPQNVVPAGDWGFAPVEIIQREQMDRRTTRAFRGSGTMFVAVPGCLSVDAVRVGPMLQDPLIVHEMPTDPSLARVIPMGHQGWRLIEGVDGVPLLQRTRFSNLGVWQKDVEIFVTGEWNTAVSPVPEIEPPSDLVSTPMGVESEPEPVTPRRGRVAA